MRGFYTVYDREASRIGFAALSGSAKDEPCDATCAGGTATDTPIDEIAWYVWLVVAICLIAIIVIPIVLMCLTPEEEEGDA